MLVFVGFVVPVPVPAASGPPPPPPPARCGKKELTFSMAASGEKLCSVEVELPWRFDFREVEEETGQCLTGLMAIGLGEMPLYQYTAPCRDLVERGPGAEGPGPGLL